jgi:hypothetical protein
MALRPGDCPFPIIPWSEVPLIEFMGLWHWAKGSGSLGVEHCWAISTTKQIAFHASFGKCG